MITDINILDQIAQGEGQYLDFKEVITNKLKIAKTLVAFANSNGGSLLVGVKDNGRIKGVDVIEEKEMLLWASEQFTFPNVALNFNTVLKDGKSILVATIEEGENKPYAALDEDGRKWSFIRYKDETLKASKVTLEVMKSEARRTQAKFTYGETEKSVLSFIEQNEFCQLSFICKKLKVPRRKVIGILVNLIRMKVVKVDFTEDKDLYYV